MGIDARIEKPHIKIQKSGTMLEIWQYEKPYVRRERKTETRKINATKTQKRVFSESNARQRVGRFKRLVLANLGALGSPAFLTLTMRDIVSYKLSQKCFHVFTTKIRKRYPELVFISVSETQQRGAIHFHVLLWGIPPEVIQNERQSRFLARLWGMGFVDIFQANDRESLAGYLAKYMHKSMLDKREPNLRYYNASRNVVRPVRYQSMEELAVSTNVWCEDEGGDKSIAFTKKYETMSLGRCDYKIYKLNP